MSHSNGEEMTPEPLSTTDEATDRDLTSWREGPWLSLKGFLMGSADVVPGVSGGTLALITGIYDRLINAVRSVDTRLVRHITTLNISAILDTFHWKFFLFLLAGIFSAVLFFTNVVPLQIYMHTDPEIIFGLFFGLIFGSIILLLKEVGRPGRSISSLAALVAGTLFGYWIVTLVPTETPDTFLFVFFSGMIAFCAMILPGISGSYLLLIFGKYDYVLGQFALIGTDFPAAVTALAPLFLGGATGIILFSRLLSWLLKSFHAVTMMVLIGFLIGSLTVIWPWQERVYETFTESVELVSLDATVVSELRETPSDGLAPEYQVLGDTVTTSSEGNDTQMMEVITLSRKLVHSDPMLPRADRPEPEVDTKLWEGIVGIVVGLVLVWGVDLLRKQGEVADA